MIEELPTHLQIAIDGPVAAGKGDIASRLAKELGLLYIYTGAMYRALGMACRKYGVNPKDKQAVIKLLHELTIDLSEPGPHGELPYNGVDVSPEIFDYGQEASDVSVIPEVRQFMVRRQQEIAKGKPVVMEGRDIGLRVLPRAQLKIYLTATVEERARRRWKQKQGKGVDESYQQVLAETRVRDEQDMNRKSDPLQKLPDAWELDTTNMTQEEVVTAIKGELARRGLL